MGNVLPLILSTACFDPGTVAFVVHVATDGFIFHSVRQKRTGNST